eukprot:CAMPEP_0196795520 /NCGR_PEP_ID=MMETSP1104-20130614/36169_1 /TAXON_ID=33652 /ORGANISM="Cafeteria sp., Strain Caron Lab Isolate" /LENGTH=40 /DNA_ID= /DNA_START= /DNA_END= /DNA_ORIENTATION=
MATTAWSSFMSPAGVCRVEDAEGDAFRGAPPAGGCAVPRS